MLPPKYVPHGRAIPANNDNALNGLHAVLVALENFPNLKEIIADRGYTIYGIAFVRPLHRMGINVVMDYKDAHQKIIKTVTIGPEGGEQVLLLHCGTFLVEWTPEYFLIPPKDLKGEKRAKWYAKRDKYRWTPIGKPDKNGAIRFRCPQCDGRVKTNAKTRIRSKRSQRKAPYATTIDQEYCCQGTLTIPVEKLDTYQHIPFGTPAWKKRYGGRGQIENLNSLVKKRRQSQRRLVPGTPTSRPQLRTPRSANRSQPTPTQQLRQRRRGTRRRTATHPHQGVSAQSAHR